MPADPTRISPEQEAGLQRHANTVTRAQLLDTALRRLDRAADRVHEGNNEAVLNDIALAGRMVVMVKKTLEEE